MAPVGSRRVRSTAMLAAVFVAAGAAANVAAASCDPAPQALVAIVRHGLRPAAHARLTTASLTRGQGRFRSVVASGVYFVSADVGRGRVATWAVTPSVVTSGQGGIFAVDRTARKVSRFGSLVPPALLATWGVSTHTRGYAASRACERRS